MEDNIAATITANLAAVQQQMDTACARAGRPVSPQLVAVSKRQPDERISAALQAGQRIFGENRVQEAQQRWEERRRG